MVAAQPFRSISNEIPMSANGPLSSRQLWEGHALRPASKALRFSCLVSLIVLEAARRGARLPRVDDDDVGRFGHGPFAYAVAEGLEARLATLPASVRS